MTRGDAPCRDGGGEMHRSGAGPDRAPGAATSLSLWLANALQSCLLPDIRPLPHVSR